MQSINWRRAGLRFVIGFCFSGVLTAISYALYSPNPVTRALQESVDVSLFVAVLVGVLSAFSEQILGFVMQLFTELFP